MAVQFTQYLRPHGKRQLIEIDLDEATEKKAQEIKAAGLCFECEVLGDDITCSFTVTDGLRGVDVDIRLATNGPEVPIKVAELINNFDLVKYQEIVAKLCALEED